MCEVATSIILLKKPFLNEARSQCGAAMLSPSTQTVKARGRVRSQFKSPHNNKALTTTHSLTDTQLAQQDFAAAMSLFNYFLYALFFALFYVSSAQAYELDKKFDSSNFLDSFDFIERPDSYTHGYANYVSKQNAMSMGLARTIGDQVYLGVDNPSHYDVNSDPGRKSVRLESHDTIDSGIIIADFEHLPANACSMWPSL